MADAGTPTRTREPIFGAPPLVALMAGLLLVLYALASFGSYESQIRMQYDFALVPARFWAAAGSPDAYPDIASKLLTLLSTALLHGGWMHVIVNSLMLLAFGTPVARAIGEGPIGWGKWMLVFVGSVAAGSIAYLLLNDHGAPAAVGASGGTSGLIAAAMLLDERGRLRSPLSSGFVTMTLAFAAMNVLLALAGPMLVGAGVAWQAHAGGYVAGALLIFVLQPRGYRQAVVT
jgi:membrane associated rhomboid family serine protease